MKDIIAYDYKAAERHGESTTSNERRYEYFDHIYLLRDRIAKRYVGPPHDFAEYVAFTEYATQHEGNRIWHRCEEGVHFGKIGPFARISEGK